MNDRTDDPNFFDPEADQRDEDFRNLQYEREILRREQAEDNQ